MSRRRARFESLTCAMRALGRETFDFKFEYPLEIDTEAGPRDSLHYYIYGDKLSWGAMRLDSTGIPRAWYRVTGALYWPSYIAWYGLVHLGHYLRHRDQMSLDIFLHQIAWLKRNAVLREDGAVVWAMIDVPDGSIVLMAPKVSAHTQGLVISALVRGWRVTREPGLLGLLTKAAKIFDLGEDDRGVRIYMDGHVLYTETPGGPTPGILDGFMTSLLGLYDLFIETGDSKVGQLFYQGIAGLKHALPRWDYRNKWSWYGSHAYLCPPAYHCLNRLLLTTLARLSGEQVFGEYAGHWALGRLSRLDRTEVFLAFLATKNAARIRYRTWRQKPMK